MNCLSVCLEIKCDSMGPCLIRLPVCAEKEADCKAVPLIRADPDSWSEQCDKEISGHQFSQKQIH